MVFLCAQPDDFYFSWQIELLVINLNQLGVKKDKIHILLAYDKMTGKNIEFYQLIKKYGDKASFYYYLDTRKKSLYISSIRPHILGKHFRKFPFLTNETIFYHDSDILFKDVKVFDIFKNSKRCFVSDTRNYLDYDYVVNSTSYNVLEKMAKIVGITTEEIYNNKINSGGAQYILNKIDYKFWIKVEKDCEEIFKVLKNHNERLWTKLFNNGVFKNKSSIGIQAWCADMWAILYNLWYYKRQVEIHPLLDFVWPDSPILEWNKRNILHYSGSQGIDTNIFRKTEYRFYPPWNDASLVKIPDTNCSSIIKKYIDLRNTQKRGDCDLLKNICIILKDIPRKSIKRNTSDIISSMYYKTILQTETTSLNTHDCQDEINKMLRLNKKVIIVSENIIIKPKDLNIIVKAMEKLVGINYKLQVNHLHIDNLMLERFRECLDINFLYQNKGKAFLESKELELTIIRNLNDLEKVRDLKVDGNPLYNNFIDCLEIKGLEVFTFEI